MQRVLIIGATSAIAGEVARAFAEAGADLFLVARSEEKLAAVRDDLRVRGGRVEARALDALDFERHAEVIDAAIDTLGGLDAALVAHGVLPDQQACERSAEEAVLVMEVNLVSTVSLLTHLANRFEAQRHGCIAVIGSVAGDRGRPSNYVYGASKAGVDAFLQGLRGRLYAAGVAVVTVKPGFVDTPMTAGLPKNPLFADPRSVGRRIHRAMLRGQPVVYAPWFWGPIMAGIRGIPESIFKRMRL